MPRKTSRISLMRRLAGLLAVGLSVAALAQSVPFPTYAPGENTTTSTGPTYSQHLSNPWVVSDGAIITPAGTQVYLGITTRAKALALNPNTSTHTAAILQMGAPQAVTIFNTQTGTVVQTYSVPYTNSEGVASNDSDGSSTGISYTPDGKYLLFSQDGNSFYGSLKQGSFVGIASVSSGGILSDYAHVSVPMDVNAGYYLTNATCFGNSPGGTTGSFLIPCGYAASIFSDAVLTSYPTGIAVSSDAKTAYVVLDNNDTLAKIDLTASHTGRGRGSPRRQRPAQRRDLSGWQDRLRLQRGRPDCYRDDFQEYSNGTPVVAAYPTGSTATGTVSVVDLASFKVTGSIETGLHPTGMAFWGKYLLVANTYSDTSR
jgi:hypothetical protein